MKLPWRKVGVDLGSCDAAMSQQFLDLVESYTVPHKPAGEGVAQAMEVKPLVNLLVRLAWFLPSGRTAVVRLRVAVE